MRIPGTAAFGGEVVLIPPLELRTRRQRYAAGGLAADQIAAHGDQRLATLRPERSNDVGRPCAPVETSDDGLFDLERVQQRDRIVRKHRLLSIPRGLV